MEQSTDSLNGIALDRAFFDLVEKFSSETSNFTRMRLRHRGDAVANFAITQAECRRRTRSKLGPLFDATKEFVFPNSLAAEQSTGCRLAAYHADLLGSGQSVADLTAGLGVDALTAAKCNKVVAFDIKADNIEALRHNARVLGVGNTLTAINADSIEQLKQHPEMTFDTIYVDPARRSETGGRVYGLSDCSPDIVANYELIMAHCRRMIVKASPMLDISAVARSLPNIAEIHLVGTPTECKEVVIAVDSTPRDPNTITLTAATITPNGETMTLSIPFQGRSETMVAERVPFEGDYIFEPYPTLMKMQRPDAISRRWQIAMLAPQTHLFTATEPLDDFQGHLYKILRIGRFDKRNIKLFQKEFPKANVAVRNFPLSAPEMVKRLKISEGGHIRLYGAQCADGANYLIACEAVSKEIH